MKVYVITFPKKKRWREEKEKFKRQKKLLLNDEFTKNNVNIIILITWLMKKCQVKFKDVLHQVSSDLGELNSFYSSFSEAGKRAICLSKVWKTLPGFRFVSTPELLFFYLSFLAPFKGKGLYTWQKWSYWYMKSHPFAYLF